MEEYWKNKEHRSYLEESHHAVQCIADNFGIVSAKSKHRAENSIWIPVNYNIPQADLKHMEEDCSQLWEYLS